MDLALTDTVCDGQHFPIESHEVDPFNHGAKRSFMDRSKFTTSRACNFSSDHHKKSANNYSSGAFGGPFLIIFTISVYARMFIFQTVNLIR